MGIKTPAEVYVFAALAPLKNLPTTWGLRRDMNFAYAGIKPLKNLPTTWGLRRKGVCLICHACLL